MKTSHSNRPALFISCTALLVAVAGAGGPVIAKAFDANNADKVDGKHAVSSGATVKQRKGKLVATNATTGRLPGNILDGKAYFPTKIPFGAQVTGYWRIDIQLPVGLTGDWDTPISFGGKMPSILSTETVRNGMTTTHCTGSVTNPTAAPGYLCVYVDYADGATSVASIDGLVDIDHAYGGAVRMNTTNAGGDAFAAGTWAARAPLAAPRASTRVGRANPGIK